MRKIRAIELFAGIGGIRLGFEKVFQERIDFVFSSDIDKFARKTYEANFGGVVADDITKIDAKDIPKHDILMAGFPCQPFSKAGLGLGFEDIRGTLFFDIIRIVKYHRPKVIFLENVKGLVTHHGGNTMVVIRKQLEMLGYRLHVKVLNSNDFDMVQSRARIYIVCFLEDYNFEFPDGVKNEKPLSTILEKDIEEFILSDKLWEGTLRRTSINKKLKRGYKHNLFKSDVTKVNTMTARYYKDGKEILIDCGKDSNPRKLSPRECGNLQGFPRGFKIVVSNTQAYKQFGNSVAINVVTEIAKKIKKVLK